MAEWIDYFWRSESPKLTQCSWSSSITSCNKMMQILMQKVVRSEINLIEQTRGTDLFSVPQTTRLTLKKRHATFPHCEQYYSANPKETSQTISTRRHNTPGWKKHMHWNSPWAHVDNQATFWLGVRHPASWMPLTQLHENESQMST